MSRTIWKFPLKVTDYQTIDTPKVCSYLAVQMQFGELMLWAEVNPNGDMRPRKIAVHGTGHEVPINENYIGTVQDAGGSLIWHVFEVL